MRFFDSLVHVTSDGSWLGGNRYDASLERLLEDMDKAHVHRACLVAIADHVCNEDVLMAYQLHPDRFIPVGSINPGSAESTNHAQQQIGELKESGFAAVKLHPRLNNYDPLDERCLAAVRAAGTNKMPVLLDTLFRQPNRITRHPVDSIDQIAKSCPDTSIVLLHSTGPTMLELFELGRMHAHLLLDLSFSMLRYQGSSLDLDMRFLCEQLDQRIVFGSDFPEYLPSHARRRMLDLTSGLPEGKLENIFFGNLERLFAKQSCLVRDSVERDISVDSANDLRETGSEEKL